MTTPPRHVPVELPEDGRGVFQYGGDAYLMPEDMILNLYKEVQEIIASGEAAFIKIDSISTSRRFLISPHIPISFVLPFSSGWG